ncbi:hypothetical protein KSP40_PGU008433 [Platanthera guangdongensis]|uniref:Uncharacterized protein n=1 Tax=Platanthera guangdongensis TaxID=2320717 RepID=A0ABR2M7F3_9ASPA
MGKNKSPAASPRRRPWRLLRLAILWAQKGGAFKQRHFFHIRLLPNYLRNNLRRSDAAGSLHFRERQLSFDDTPTFHFKMRRPASFRLPRIPCITPSVNFDDDDDNEISWENYRKMKLLEARSSRNHEKRSDGSDLLEEEDEDMEEEEEEEEQEIDSRAERFIMEFYDQMKLQRQISYLEYDEMLHRGTS